MLEVTFSGRQTEKLSHTRMDDVLEYVDKLEMNKSLGPDGIQSNVMRNSDLKFLICHLFFMSASVPENWKGSQ